MNDMFWDKRFKELEKEIKDLKYKTLGEEKKEEKKSRTGNLINDVVNDYWRSSLLMFEGWYKPTSLKERIDKLEEKLDALLTHLKLESKTVTTEASEKCKIVKKETKKK